MLFKSCEFVILDAARMGAAIRKARSFGAEHVSLYKGASETDLASVAPYIFDLSSGGGLANWLLSEGWSKGWAVYVKSPAKMDELRSHFRKFLFVRTQQGRDWYFRFYDPRVLLHALPTFGLDQLTSFFGPVQQFVLESENPKIAVAFSLKHSQLQVEQEGVVSQ